MSESNNSQKYSLAHRYLPLLSLLLVVASIGLLLKMYMERPSNDRERQIEAFARALEEIPERYVGEVTGDELYQAAMRGMTETLDDPYSAYMSPYELENEDRETQGEFGGIGVRVSPRNGGAIVIDVQQDSPAQEAGIEPGDVLVGVDGNSAREMPFVQLISLVRGKVGTEVELTINKVDDDREQNVTVMRAQIDTESVTWRWLDDGIGYISIRQFSKGVGKRVRDALMDMLSSGKLEAVLLDVRGNTGGLLQEAVEVSDMFMKGGIVAQLNSRVEEEKMLFKAEGETIIPRDVPVAILVDGRSASASEVFAGAMQAVGRAEIVGVKTFGKGGVNRILPLPDGSGIVLTVAEYTVDDELIIEGKGVKPDITVGTIDPPDAIQTREEGQKWLQQHQLAQKQQYDRAIEYLKTRIDADT
ncbi:MAG: S41 family peptidase, partial [Planctomycetota bacterium]